MHLVGCLHYCLKKDSAPCCKEVSKDNKNPVLFTIFSVLYFVTTVPHLFKIDNCLHFVKNLQFNAGWDPKLFMTHFDTAINRRNCETGLFLSVQPTIELLISKPHTNGAYCSSPFSDYTQLWLLLSLLGPRCRLHRRLPLCKVISRHLHISTNYILHIHYGRNSKIAIQTLSKPLWRPVLHQSRSHSQLSPSTYKRQASPTGNTLSSSQHEHTQICLYVRTLFMRTHEVRGNCTNGKFCHFTGQW